MTQPFHFSYVSPEIVRGEDRDDFVLQYFEQGKRVSLNGRLPRADRPGYLDFPDDVSWANRVPEWAKERRQEIEGRLLDYAKTNFDLKWVTPSNFGPVPRRPPLSEEEVQANVAVIEAAQNEYQATKRRMRLLNRAVNIAGVLMVLGAIVFAAAKLGLFQ